MADVLMGVPFEYEPKRQNRFLFQFTDDTLPAYIARTASRPSFTQETITIDYLNSKRYLAGKFEWNTMTLGYMTQSHHLLLKR